MEQKGSVTDGAPGVGWGFIPVALEAALQIGEIVGKSSEIRFRCAEST